ncbi:MAG TPA: prolyl oligopeptidase family serine peptidase [Pirellulaceae bacterium]|nr:prolyl oligopeptidase family serine peptidase [Pirellulaceae bacterium]
MSYPGPNYQSPNQNYPSRGHPGSSYPGSSYPGQGGPSPFGPNPSDIYGQAQYPPPRSSGSGCLWTFLAILGVGGLAMIACCGALIWFTTTTPQPSPAASQPWNVAAIKVPALPDRGQPTRTLSEDGGVVMYTIRLGESGDYDPPGHGGEMFLFLPPGEHAVGSLPCVLITGAGTTLLEGYDFAGDPQETGDADEFIPYAKAGIAVLAYELDGSMVFANTDREAFDAFRASCAGLVNARNALEFVLARVPEVNPRQIYAAGHSSAGTAALLFAEHEPRLAGCVAYAPCSDVQSRISDEMPGFLHRAREMDLPGLTDFIVRSSPRTHESRLNCPVFLFHADDDWNTPVSETRSFAERLQAVGKSVTLKTVPSGGHYDSMIEEGIPAGIEWIKAQSAQK